MQGYFLVYSFACFSVGIACLGVTLFAARRRDDTLARAFLVFYISLSLMVTGALLRSFIGAFPAPVSPATLFAVEYLESIVGRYAVMFTSGFFAHRVFADRETWRNVVLAAIVIGAVVLQHVTEFWLGGVWDDRGDVFEDVLSAGLIAYGVLLGLTRLGDPRVERPLAVRFLALLALGLPGIAFDLFLSDHTALRFYPAWYCAFSIVMSWYLIRRPTAVRPGSILRQWDLSRRESEVTRLVLQGLSNKDIAEQLNISPNTVKTHLRAVFDKSGMHSRFELISAAQPGTPNPPQSA